MKQDATDKNGQLSQIIPNLEQLHPVANPRFDFLKG
jgi:hypothetical protein